MVRFSLACVLSLCCATALRAGVVVVPRAGVAAPPSSWSWQSWGSPWGGYSGGGYPWSSGYYSGPYVPSYGVSPVYGAPIVPSYGVSPGYSSHYEDPPRMRPTTYPAIPLPPRDVIKAKLEGADDVRGYFDVTVPTADAKVWLNDTLMTQTGLTRQFKTPELKDGEPYLCHIRVQWRDASGRESTINRTIRVRPGNFQKVDARW